MLLSNMASNFPFSTCTLSGFIIKVTAVKDLSFFLVSGNRLEKIVSPLFEASVKLVIVLYFYKYIWIYYIILKCYIVFIVVIFHQYFLLMNLAYSSILLMVLKSGFWLSSLLLSSIHMHALSFLNSFLINFYILFCHSFPNFLNRTHRLLFFSSNIYTWGHILSFI